MCVFWTWGSYASVSVEHLCVFVEQGKVIYVCLLNMGKLGIYLCLFNTGTILNRSKSNFKLYLWISSPKARSSVRK